MDRQLPRALEGNAATRIAIIFGGALGCCAVTDHPCVAQTNSNIINLVCTGKMKLINLSTLQGYAYDDTRTYVVDLNENTVNGHPAKITQQYITICTDCFRPTARNSLKIDRISGTVWEALSLEEYFEGTCVKSKGEKF